VTTATTTSTTTSTTISSTTSVATTESTTGSTRPTTVTAPTTTTVAGTPGTIRLADAENGKTVTVTRGTTIVVVLNSTYWTFPTAPDAAVLQQQGGSTVTPAPVGTCVPGGGCGTASVTYKVVGAGRSQVTASRTTCGEAMGCVGNAGSYAVQIVVAG